MIIIKQGLTGKNPAAKVVYGTELVNGFTLNPNFTDVGAYLTTLESATANLDKANGAKDITNRDIMEAAFDIAVKAIVMYAQNKILNVPDLKAIEMVESANLTYVKRGKPIYGDLEVTAGEAPLSANIRKKVTTKKKNVAYVCEVCQDPATEAGYKLCMISTNATFIITTGILPLIKYWYRVATVEGQVMSAFCSPTSFTTS